MNVLATPANNSWTFHCAAKSNPSLANAIPAVSAYGIQLKPALLVYARVSRAFRAPSFNDLCFPGFSNPLPKPERSEQAEVGVRWTSALARASLVRFDHRIDDLIAPDFISFIPVNTPSARIKGW